MKFIALDFETANSKRSSACSIGLAFVEDGTITHSESYFIKPTPYYFDPYNTYIHGIKKEMVADAPTFDELWESKLKSKFQNSFVVCHNASFDMSVLRNMFESYNITFPQLKYGCTLVASKLTLQGLTNYQLPTVCQELGIELHNHHQATDDAIASAQVLLSIAKLNPCQSIEKLFENIGAKHGILFDDNTYKPCTSRKENSKPVIVFDDIDISDSWQDNPLYGKTIAITGTLNGMTRAHAHKIILSNGGIYANSLTKNTNYLVCGGFDLYGPGYESTKTTQAKKYIEQGIDLEIISEKEFMSLVHSQESPESITIEKIRDGSKRVLDRNVYGEFCRETTFVSSSVEAGQSEVWQMLGNSGGSACFVPEDVKSAGYAIFSKDDMEALEAGQKTEDVLQVERALWEAASHGELKNIIVLNEDTFIKHDKLKKDHNTNPMNIIKPTKF